MTVQTEFAASLRLSIDGGATDLSIKILAVLELEILPGLPEFFYGLQRIASRSPDKRLPPPFSCVSIRRVDLKRLGVTLTLESGLGVWHALRPRALRADPGTKAAFSTFSF